MYRQIEKLCKTYGFTIVPLGAMINGVWVTRPDIASVKKAGFGLLTIPKVIYDHPTKAKTLEGLQQPMFYELEYKLKSWANVIQRSPWMNNRDQQERELIRLYENTNN